MKIMQIMLSRGFGGAERLFVDCCKSMANFGFEIIAVCSPYFVEIDELCHENIEIVTLDTHFDYSILARIHLRSIVLLYKPDVIHTHLCRGAIIGGYVGKHCGIPVAANIHNYVKLKYYQNISKFIPGTLDQKKYLISKGVNSEKIEVIPHFSLLPPDNSIIPFNNNVLISYGRFVKKKGFDILLSALKIVVDSGVDVFLHLGGDGPERLHLENTVKNLGIEKNVEFAGWVENVNQFLEKGNIFVLPSIDEPFGIVILEAMAKGKIIVSSKAKGPVEVLNSNTAWMFEISDVEDMAYAIINALNCMDISLVKAQNALDEYKEKYSSSRVIPQYISVFQKMCGH